MQNKRVMIATPCHDRKLPVEYVGALLDSMRADLPVVIAPVFLPGEAMLPHARNFLMKIFLESDFDTIIYIDADMLWSPEQLGKILLSKEPVVSAVARLKHENAPFNFRELEGEKVDKNGLLAVESIGCAFMKIEREVLDTMQTSTYTVHDSEYRNFFHYDITNENDFVGEDIVFSRKIRAAGYSIIADLQTIVGHIGSKVY